MSNLKIVSLCIFTIGALFWGGCGEKRDDTAIKTESVKKAEILELKDENETVKAILHHKGISFEVKEPVVMVNFFATWCPPCKAEIPHLINLQNRYRNRFKIIAILVEENVPNRVIERFKKNYGINYFVSNSAKNMKIASFAADMLHQPQNFSIPMMILLVKGKYFRHYIGMVPEEMLESDIKEALKEVDR